MDISDQVGGLLICLCATDGEEGSLIPLSRSVISGWPRDLWNPRAPV